MCFKWGSSRINSGTRIPVALKVWDCVYWGLSAGTW